MFDLPPVCFLFPNKFVVFIYFYVLKIILKRKKSGRKMCHRLAASSSSSHLFLRKFEWWFLSEGRTDGRTRMMILKYSKNFPVSSYSRFSVRDANIVKQTSSKTKFHLSTNVSENWTFDECKNTAIITFYRLNTAEKLSLETYWEI